MTLDEMKLAIDNARKKGNATIEGEGDPNAVQTAVAKPATKKKKNNKKKTSPIKPAPIALTPSKVTPTKGAPNTPSIIGTPSTVAPQTPVLKRPAAAPAPMLKRPAAVGLEVKDAPAMPNLEQRATHDVWGCVVYVIPEKKHFLVLPWPKCRYDKIFAWHSDVDSAWVRCWQWCHTPTGIPAHHKRPRL